MKKARLAPRKRTHYLSAYRRHADSCTVTNDLQCDCPLWVQGKLNGKYVRESLGTRSMAMAELKIRDMLQPPSGSGGGGATVASITNGMVTLAEAAATFLANKQDKASNTVDLYTRAVGHFRRFAEAHGTVYLAAVTPLLVQQYFLEYAAEWKSPRTRRGRLTHLRVFCNFCKKDMQWILRSPAEGRSLNVPKQGHARPPYTLEEVQRILEAVERMPEASRDRARALILVLLYSGMRISDATFCQRADISPERVLDYVVIKTHKPISLPFEVPATMIDALVRLPGSGSFFFQPEWDYSTAITALREGGNFEAHLPKGFYKQAIRDTTALVTRVLALAGVRGGCHKFRDTFAVNLLVNGADIYKVSLMLGHSDVKITSDHYLNLVPGYRERMSQATRCLTYQAPLVRVKG
jgi:integrase/recombinase XerD